MPRPSSRTPRRRGWPSGCPAAGAARLPKSRTPGAAAIDTAELVDAMIARWAVGGEARALAPQEWAELVAPWGGPRAERALLALTGQYQAVALRPALPPGFVRRPQLARLEVPLVPESLRGALKAALGIGTSAEALIRMVARRGFSVHPADWFPGRQPGWIPEFYDPWIEWQHHGARSASAGSPADGADADPADAAGIVARRVRELAAGLALPVPRGVETQIKEVLTVFRELRYGETGDGKVTLKTPSGTLSTAEAIGTLVGSLSQATWFANGRLGADQLAGSMVGAIAKDPVQDPAVLAEYLETVLKKRRAYARYYAALSEAL